MSARILIRDGCVLTLGDKTQNFSRADVLIEDGLIVEVGSGLRSRGAEVVDAEDTIVMPGFVDTHRHFWKSLFRNLGDGDSSVSAEVFGPHYQADDLYAATLIGLLGALGSGITTVVDWSDIQMSPEHTTAALQAHTDAGIRSVFVPVAPSWADHHERSDDTSRDMSVRSELTTLAHGAGTVDGTDPEIVAPGWESARASGLRTHAHVGMSPERRGEISGLARSGLLDDMATLVHGSHLEASDLDLVASAGSLLSLTPASDMASGRGVPPIQGVIDRNIGTGLGVDDEAVAPGDIFAQMRAANSLQHATMFDLKLAGKAGLPKLLNTRQVIKFATSGGARVAGLGTITGSIEPGKHADIIILRTDRPNIHPINDPIGAVVWGMDTSNVDLVFVGGRAVVRGGILQTDVEEARSAATKSRQRVAGASGMMTASLSGDQR